jgi:hypothetical protein
MYWTLQNLKDSENKQQIVYYSSIFSAAMVLNAVTQRLGGWATTPRAPPMQNPQQNARPRPEILHFEGLWFYAGRWYHHLVTELV